MPSPERQARAKALGLCLECAYLPPREGFALCARCHETVVARKRRHAMVDNAKRRIRSHHHSALRKWFAAGGQGKAPLPPTFVPIPLWNQDRKRPWRRRKPKKPYVYTPRPLPKRHDSC